MISKLRLALKNESGVSIIEALIGLFLISLAVIAANRQFLDNREATVIRKARALFDKDMVKVMFLTRENSVCERLNLMGLTMPGINNQVDLKSLTYDGMTILDTAALPPQKMKDKLYKIKSIKLSQTSNQFGVKPKRARAQLDVEAVFYNTKGEELKMTARKDKDTKAYAEFIISSQNGTTIDSCYGYYSRKMTCHDENKSYNAENDPSCL